jgi:predicted transcriptional regulator
MKSILRFLLVPVVTLTFAGAVSAQTGPTGGTGPSKSSTPSTKSDTTKSTDKKAAAKTQRVRGELTAADAKAGTAKVKTKDKELSLSTESQEVKDSLAKMKVGDTVRVAYTDSDGKLMLKAISKTKLPATKSGSTSSSTTSKSSTDTKPATK